MGLNFFTVHILNVTVIFHAEVLLDFIRRSILQVCGTMVDIAL